MRENCRYHFTVRLGFQFSVQLVLFDQLSVVFNNTVVNNGDLAIAVRMCILITHSSVRCPSGMTDSTMPGNVLFFTQKAKILYSSRTLDNSCRSRLLTGKGDSGTVIPSVLQKLQGIQHDLACLFCSCISYNSTHIIFLIFLNSSYVNLISISLLTILTGKLADIFFQIRFPSKFPSSVIPYLFCSHLHICRHIPHRKDAEGHPPNFR